MPMLSPDTIALHQNWRDAQKAVLNYRHQDDPRRLSLAKFKKNPIRPAALRFINAIIEDIALSAVFLLPFIAVSTLSAFGLAIQIMGFIWITVLGQEGEPPRGLWGTPIPYLVTVLVCTAIVWFFWSVVTQYEKIVNQSDAVEGLRKEVAVARNALFDAVSNDLAAHDFHVISKDRRNLSFVTTDGVVTFITDGVSEEPTLLINGSPMIDGYSSLLTRTDHVARTLHGDTLRTKAPMTFEQFRQRHTESRRKAQTAQPTGDVVGATRDNAGHVLRLLVRKQ